MANQLQNLKRIHELQKDGEITNILKEIRSSKKQVEEFGHNLASRIKEIQIENKNIEEKKADTIKKDFEKYIWLW